MSKTAHRKTKAGPPKTKAAVGAPPVLLVTGVSGAGKSSALKALEDLGYEAVDNLPVSLIGRLANPDGVPHPLALRPGVYLVSWTGAAGSGIQRLSVL